MWNFLWRLGIHPQDCTIDALPNPHESVLWAVLREGDPAPRLDALREWIARGGYVVAEGHPASAAALFGWDANAWTATTPENPYAALASIVPGRAPELLSPPRWSFAACVRPQPRLTTRGHLAAVQGERQTPSRALIISVADAPALVTGSNYCYVNGNAFAAFQAWLQGQEDLQPWLGWRHRLFWLDEWVSAMAESLSALPALSPALPRPGIEGLSDTTVVFRHDVDHSRDLSYLQEESVRGLPGTHGVLRDSNTAFWRRAIAAQPNHECAFHYNTARRNRLRESWMRLRRRGAAAVLARRAAVTGRGLSRQVQWAKRHGLGTSSLLRHMGFLVYPEWVDALDDVFDGHTEVRGGSSMFRAQVLRWGVDRADGVAGTIGEWPDAQFPLWYPFKLAHAGDGGRRLRGWETTSIMEGEPELVDQMLSHSIPHIRQRVITLGYHPAHARGATFHRAGSREAFSRVLDVVTRYGAQVTTLGAVFALADGDSAVQCGQRG